MTKKRKQYRNINKPMNKKNKYKLYVFITMIIGSIVFLLSALFIPKLKLETNTLEVEVFNEYKPISYTAKVFNKDLSDKVKIDGIVDTNLLGEYNITYELREGFFDIKKMLKVKVVDHISPDLKLIGEEHYSVCSMSKFIEPGYTALDNYDGDLTSNVIKRYIDNNTIEYSVKDSSGNIKKANRTLTEEDIKGPDIILNGEEKITLNVGDSYNEAGARAIDNCEGDLTNTMDVTGNVNTSSAGEYKIIYKVSDSKGNESQKTRVVTVQEIKKEVEIPPATEVEENTSGIIYLTFDDGPGSYTNTILDTLKNNDVKATFFVTLAGSDDVLKREHDEGHTVALHTYSHNYATVY